MIGKLLPVAEPVVLGIIGLVKGIVGVVVNVVNAIIRTLNKINFTVPDWVPALGGKQFGFNLTEVTLPKFADGGFTMGRLWLAKQAPKQSSVSAALSVSRTSTHGCRLARCWAFPLRRL